MATPPTARMPACAGWRTRQVAVSANENVAFQTSGHQNSDLSPDTERASGVRKKGISIAIRIVARPSRYFVQYQDCGGIGLERQNVLTPPCKSPITAPTPIRMASTKPPAHNTGGRAPVTSSQFVLGLPVIPSPPHTKLVNSAITNTCSPKKPISREPFQMSAAIGAGIAVGRQKAIVQGRPVRSEEEPRAR